MKVDIDDLELVDKYCIHFADYAWATVGKIIIPFHNLLMNHTPSNMTVDHQNQDKLDNRRCNLRISSASEQMINRSILSSNTSGIVGVSFDNHHQAWCAYWINTSGTRETRIFSIKKYGENAKQLAINHRKFIEESMDKYKNAFDN